MGECAPSTGAVGPATLDPPLPVAGTLLGALAAVDDRPGADGGLAGAAFAVEFDDVGAQGGVLLVAADHWYSSAGGRGRAGRAPGLSATNTGSSVGVAAGCCAGVPQR
jgi:hypothetical protein